MVSKSITSFKVSPQRLLWLSRLWRAYTLTIVTFGFLHAHFSVYPTLHPNTFSPLSLLHRFFSLYLFLNFFINFYLSYANHSFQPLPDPQPSLPSSCNEELVECKMGDTGRELSATRSHHNPSTFHPNPSTFHPTHHNPSTFHPSHLIDDESFCKDCSSVKPLKCHHCIICKRCVLGREHHCFVLGTCIGFNNLRHFICILLLLTIASFYSLTQLLQYLPLFYPSPFSPLSLLHYFPPITVFEVLLGYLPWHFLCYLFLLFTIMAALVGGAYSFIFFLLLTLRGVTSHEHHTHQPPPKRPPFTNFKNTFGTRWYLGILCPLLYQPIRIETGVKSV